MSERLLCPPGYNGGFCAYYDVDYDYEERCEEYNELLAKIIEITRKGYLIYFDDDAGSKLGFFRIKLVDPRTQLNLSRAVFLGKTIDFSTNRPTVEVIEILDKMVKMLEEEENESKG